MSKKVKRKRGGVVTTPPKNYPLLIGGFRDKSESECKCSEGEWVTRKVFNWPVFFVFLVVVWFFLFGLGFWIEKAWGLDFLSPLGVVGSVFGFFSLMISGFLAGEVFEREVEVWEKKRRFMDFLDLGCPRRGVL